MAPSGKVPNGARPGIEAVGLLDRIDGAASDPEAADEAVGAGSDLPDGKRAVPLLRGEEEGAIDGSEQGRWSLRAGQRHASDADILLADH